MVSSEFWGERAVFGGCAANNRLGTASLLQSSRADPASHGLAWGFLLKNSWVFLHLSWLWLGNFCCWLLEGDFTFFCWIF